MKRICSAYKELLSILFSESPALVIIAFTSAILSGLITPLSIWVNSRIFDLGLLTASGEMSFPAYIPYLILFVLLSLLPVLVGDILSNSYIRPKCQLIFRTAYKGKMLRKLKTLRYEHLESPSSMEIIDKAYSKTENAVLALFPATIRQIISAGIATVGALYLFAAVKWWLLLVILVPFVLETRLVRKANYDIYNEMETYWKKERFYTGLGNMLRSRDYVRENTLYGISDYLIDIYRRRMNSCNREYEHFFLKHLRRNFMKQNLIKLAQLGTTLSLLFLYSEGGLRIGSLISLSLAVFAKLFSQNGLNGLVQVIRTSGQHINAFAFCDRFFGLSEEEYGRESAMPERFEIEFDNVSFTYPGAEKKIMCFWAIYSENAVRGTLRKPLPLPDWQGKTGRAFWGRISAALICPAENGRSCPLRGSCTGTGISSCWMNRPVISIRWRKRKFFRNIWTWQGIRQ